MFLSAMAMPAIGDGKMFWREKVPPTIPYQRALILFKDGTETLVLQSKYEIPKKETKASLGWVVPAPAVPEVATMRADAAQHMFLTLNLMSRPRVTSISDIVFPPCIRLPSQVRVAIRPKSLYTLRRRRR
jgi:hypothetical protein